MCIRDSFILWHDLEAERHAIKTAMPEAVDIYGSMDYDERERRVIAFSEGKTRLFLSLIHILDTAGVDRVRVGVAGAVPAARGRKTPKEAGRMPQAVAQSRVIWRHPRGRFDVIETRGTSPLGPPYAIRETVFTPERDKRGQINEPVNNKIFRCV